MVNGFRLHLRNGWNFAVRRRNAFRPQACCFFALYTLTATFRSAAVREHWVHSCCLISCGGEVNSIFWAQEPIFWPVARHNA
jgi:hypothetical protein